MEKNYRYNFSEEEISLACVLLELRRGKPQKEEAILQVEPIEHMVPAAPIDAAPMELVEPMAPARPMEPAEPLVAAEPVEPVGPVGPVGPVEHLEPEVPMEPANDEVNNNATTRMAYIGSGQTSVPLSKFNKIKWNSYTVATRQLLLAKFSRSVLATHSLSGKKSPAFRNKPAKACLPQQAARDIILEIVLRFNVTKGMVRKVITTKCADESKMLKMRQKKNPS